MAEQPLILIIDDHRDFCEDMSAILAARFKTESSHNGQDGLAAVTPLIVDPAQVGGGIGSAESGSQQNLTRVVNRSECDGATGFAQLPGHQETRFGGGHLDCHIDPQPGQQGQLAAVVDHLFGGASPGLQMNFTGSQVNCQLGEPFKVGQGTGLT